MMNKHFWKSFISLFVSLILFTNSFSGFVFADELYMAESAREAGEYISDASDDASYEVPDETYPDITEEYPSDETPDVTDDETDAADIIDTDTEEEIQEEEYEEYIELNSDDSSAELIEDNGTDEFDEADETEENNDVVFEETLHSADGDYVLSVSCADFEGDVLYTEEIKDSAVLEEMAGVIKKSLQDLSFCYAFNIKVKDADDNEAEAVDVSVLLPFRAENIRVVCGTEEADVTVDGDKISFRADHPDCAIFSDSLVSKTVCLSAGDDRIVLEGEMPLYEMGTVEKDDGYNVQIYANEYLKQMDASWRGPVKMRIESDDFQAESLDILDAEEGISQTADVEDNAVEIDASGSSTYRVEGSRYTEDVCSITADGNICVEEKSCDDVEGYKNCRAYEITGDASNLCFSSFSAKRPVVMKDGDAESAVMTEDAEKAVEKTVNLPFEPGTYVVGQKITEKVFEGDGVRIVCDEDAVPEDAELETRKVAETDARIDSLKEVLGEYLTDIEFRDISIGDGSCEMPVDVYVDTKATHVVHFAKDGIEEIPCVTTDDGVLFQTDSFSVYGFANQLHTIYSDSKIKLLSLSEDEKVEEIKAEAEEGLEVLKAFSSNELWAEADADVYEIENGKVANLLEE